MEIQSIDFLKNIDTAAENMQKEFEQRQMQKQKVVVENTTSVQRTECNILYRSAKSIYQKNLSKNKIITEFYTYILDLKALGTKCIELSHEDKITTLKQHSNISIIEMLEILSEGDNRGKEEFLATLQFNKEYTGKSVVEKYGLTISHKTTTSGVVSAGQVEDKFAYRYTGKGFDDFDNYNCTELSIKVANAFSKAYPYYPVGDNMVIDLEKIANQDDSLSIGSVAHIFRGYANTGYIEFINTNLNTKHKFYLQSIRFLNKKELPILDRTGTFEIDSIPVRTDMFNAGKSEKEIKYNINLMRTPKTLKNLHTFVGGEIGFISNGEIVCAERSTLYSDLYPAFNIYSTVNVKKTKRFKENTRLKKAVNSKFISNVDSKTIIETKLIAENVVINSETEFIFKLMEYLGDKQPILNLDGGSFDMEYGKGKEVREKTYTDETTWAEISTINKLENETDESYNLRMYTVANMGRRFASTTNIKGLYTTKNGKKYSQSAANMIGVTCMNKEGKTLNIDELNKMQVQQVVNFDMLNSMTKSFCVYENSEIDARNKEARKAIELYFKGDEGKSIKFELVVNKDKYLKEKINRIIKQHIKQNPCNDVDLETLKKAHRVKNVEEKIALLKRILEINLLQLEQQYYMMKELAESTINFFIDYEYADTLNMRDREKLSRIAEDYRKATGRVLEIQGLKIQVVDLSKEIIKENKEAVKQLGKEDKEIKDLLRKQNKHLSRLNKVLNKNIYTETTYSNLVTAKCNILLNEECKILLDISKQIIESNIQNKIEYDISKQNNLQIHLNSILNRDFEIQVGSDYSLYWFKLSNTHTKLDLEDSIPRYGRSLCV